MQIPVKLSTIILRSTILKNHKLVSCLFSVRATELLAANSGGAPLSKLLGVRAPRVAHGPFDGEVLC